jgi:hypothetical protein
VRVTSSDGGTARESVRTTSDPLEGDEETGGATRAVEGFLDAGAAAIAAVTVLTSNAVNPNLNLFMCDLDSSITRRRTGASCSPGIAAEVIKAVTAGTSKATKI